MWSNPHRFYWPNLRATSQSSGGPDGRVCGTGELVIANMAIGGTMIGSRVAVVAIILLSMFGTQPARGNDSDKLAMAEVLDCYSSYVERYATAVSDVTATELAIAASAHCADELEEFAAKLTEGRNEDAHAIVFGEKGQRAEVEELEKRAFAHALDVYVKTRAIF